MIQLLKDIYLTGFTIIFRLSAAPKLAYRAGGAVTIITLIQAFNLANITGWIDIFAGKHVMPRLSDGGHLVVYLSLVFLNIYILFKCGLTSAHGLKFEREFDTMKKNRKALLVTCCVVLALATIVFTFYSTLAYRRFFSVK